MLKLNNQINRTQDRLAVSGKRFPNIGGGWNCSRYNENDFISKSRKIGVIFQSKNSGHCKVLLKDAIITDPLIVSLHNTTTQAAKDIVRYVSKYMIIKIAYSLIGKEFQNNRDFFYHQNKLFENTDDLNYQYLREINKKINRNFVINYVKKCFIDGDKLNFQLLKNKSIE